MTNDTQRRPPACAPGCSSRSPRQCRSGSPAHWRAACSTPAGAPGAVVLARLSLGALVVAPLAARALRGRWGALRKHVGFVLLFGALPVAGAQFGYFSAVAAMDVGPALLIEYTAPAAVVVWLWLRHGERPGPLTVAGAGIAALGLILVLDLLSGADLAPGRRVLGAGRDGRRRLVLRARRQAAHRTCRRSRWRAPG